MVVCVILFFLCSLVHGGMFVCFAFSVLLVKTFSFSSYIYFFFFAPLLILLYLLFLATSYIFSLLPFLFLLLIHLLSICNSLYFSFSSSSSSSSFLESFAIFSSSRVLFHFSFYLSSVFYILSYPPLPLPLFLSLTVFILLCCHLFNHVLNGPVAVGSERHRPIIIEVVLALHQSAYRSHLRYSRAHPISCVSALGRDQ